MIQLKNISIEHFFLFSLFFWFFIGYSGFLNALLLLQFIFIFFFLEFKINFLKLIINVIISGLLILFAENIDAIKIYFIFLIIIFSFDFKNKTKNVINNHGYLLFIIIFFVTFFFKHSPHIINNEVRYKLNINNIIERNDYSVEEINILKKRNPITSSNLTIPEVCFNKKKLFEKEFCSKHNNYLQNRFTINGVDVNFVSIILLTLLYLSFFSLKSKSKYLLFFYIILGILILFLTKSRAGLIFLLMSLITLFLSNFDLKKILVTFILIHFLIIFVGYVMVNSVSDPMMMSAPKISDSGLINFPISKSHGSIELFRLFTAFDSSNFIRFSSFFQTFLIYLNEFNIVLYPDHTNLVSEINYKTFTGKNFIVKSTDYDPHNFTMGMIKELGLLATIYLLVFLFNFLKHDRFRSLILPLLLSSIFLGTVTIYLIPTILIFSCVPKNNFTNIIQKIKTWM